MNNILKYLCFVLFGIIIYLLLRNIGKKERFSISNQSCISNDISNNIFNCPSDQCLVVDTGILMQDNICVRQSLNWFTNDNEYGIKMIPHIHNQGECGTCGIYSIIYVFECMYNISKVKADPSFLPISISPQSLIDIFGRYYSKINTCFNNLNQDYYSNSMPSSDDGCDCSNPDVGNVSMCGFNWLCGFDFFRPNTILYNFAKLKTLDEDKFSEFNFSYPLIKEYAVNRENRIYNTITSCPQDERNLFNVENLETIQADNYLYTDSFNKEDLIDFHFNWDRIFPMNFTDIGLDVYTNKLKKQLNNGPIIINIRIDEDYNPDEPHTILDNTDLRNVLTDHFITIIGYNDDRIIILNSWNEYEDLIENVTFEELYSCHAFVLQDNLPWMTFLNYNYIYIELFTEEEDKILAYNPNKIDRYLTSCGVSIPLTLLGVGLVGISIAAYKRLKCPCNSCAASQSNPYSDIVAVDDVDTSDEELGTSVPVLGTSIPVDDDGRP